MNTKRITRIAIGLLTIISIVTVGIIACIRMNIERASNSIEIMMEFSEVKKLAAKSDYSEEEWMRELGDSGLYSIAILEETLLKYITEKGITYKVSGQIFNQGDWETRYPKPVIDELKNSNEYSLFIETENEEEFDTIVNGLDFYESIEFSTFQEQGYYSVLIKQEEKDLLYEKTGEIYNSAGSMVGENRDIYGTEVLNIPIGFDKEKIELIQKAGLMLVLRPVNYEKDPISSWKLYASEIEKYGTGSGLLFFDGEGVVGSGQDEKYVSEIEAFIKKNDMKIVLLETIEQREYFTTDGLKPIIDKLSKDSFLRAFNIWDFIANRYKYNSFYEGGEEIGNSIFRAVTERNIKAIYFRPFVQANNEYVTNMDDYKDMFSELETRLQGHGYKYGAASAFEDFSLPFAVKILLTLEVSLFGLLLLNVVFGLLNYKFNLAMILLCVIGSVAAHYIMPSMSIKLSALAAAIIFSTLSVVVYTKYYLLTEGIKGIKNGVFALLAASIISVLGALYVATIMTDTSYFLELDLFTGVKVSLLVPIMLTIFAVFIFYVKELAKNSNKSIVKELIDTSKRFLNMNVKIKYGILLVVIAAVGYIYLARTGNESSLEPMRIEIMLRNFLEKTLLARPRTKEFLIAFPAMVVGVYYASAKFIKKDLIIKYIYVVGFALLAAIGQTSITNTFSHIRTPLYMSLARTGYSIAFGMVIGILAIIAINLINIIIKKIMNTEKIKKLGLFE